MHSTNKPLFTTYCLGATISHVHVFPTHIRYQQKFGRDISVPSDTIASVEKHVYEHGFVILSTTSRRRIICVVQRKRADALYKAVRNAQNHLIITSRMSAQKNPARRQYYGLEGAYAQPTTGRVLHVEHLPGNKKHYDYKKQNH